MKIKIFQYNNATAIDLYLLNDLLLSIWKDVDNREIHPEEMDAMSFCVVENKRCIGYTGVVQWDVQVQDETFKMCGLSCVCTHPQYRNRGIGSTLVKEATKWIIQSNSFDIGLFTCSPENTSFYKKIGSWEISSGLILKESNRKNAYSSDLLKVNVFKLLLSQKAKSYASYFENGTVTLNFPTGKFI